MIERKLFGTDGIRGKANVYPMTGEIAMALGRAVTSYFQKRGSQRTRPLIIIGKDTRRSCYMLEQSFGAGVMSQGGRVIFTGPLPTPGVAFVTQSMRADAGVMISASHNPFYDNGIKIFDRNGNKLPDEVEAELEHMMFHPELLEKKVGEELGTAKRLDEVAGRYIVHAKAAFSKEYTLEGMRLVVDCANGAAYKMAPMVFEELGAEVIAIGMQPNGVNINQGCGAMHPEFCAESVVKYRADLGICLDGDADRLVVIDNRGKIIDGDALIGVMATFLHRTGGLDKDANVVGTLMSNLGLENYLIDQGMKFHRVNVGDRYIIEKLAEIQGVFGGEPSGHLILKNYATTGDGILAALKVIEAIHYYKKPIDQIVSQVKLYPQTLKNVNVSKKTPFDQLPKVMQELARVEQKLGKKGRVVLRYSGTESKARVMIEGEDAKFIEELADQLAQVIEKELK
jgi:phosphoglucosamine mutase